LCCMYADYINKLQKPSGIHIGSKELIFFTILCTIGIVFYLSLYNQTPTPLVILTVPLALYHRAFIFPMLMAITLSQGAYSDATSGVGTADASFAESSTIMALAPILAYDLLTKKSKMVPYRFAIIYLFFFIFIYIGLFVYFQHPENYAALPGATSRYAVIPHGIMKSIKVVFYLFFLRVLINYPVSTNYSIVEYTRRCTPFIILPLGVYLLTNGRVQNGAGYTGSLQLGDAHHGAFTSQLCALAIYLYITLFSRKPGIDWFTRLFSLGSIVMVGIMIMMMGSRNGLLSFFIVTCLGVWIHLQRRSIDFGFIVFLVCFVGAIVTVALSWQSPTVQRAIYMTDQAGGGDRTYYWAAGLDALKTSPVFGMGGDETASISAVARNAPSMVADRVMHNTYLEVAVEYGVIALVLYLVLVWCILKWSWRLYKLALDRNDMQLAGPGLSYLIMMIAAIFISDIWDSSIWYTQSVILAHAIQLLYPQYINKRRVNTKLSFNQLMSESHMSRI
jgi:hypothetical protein